ncbi:MAG: 3,4-dihydroxy-2-butanone-4-phosphate synthase [Alphaproteobacteria bacterium]|nr:3,4-dihydroxy-2-butanone-4-phosphate synthase [Alphaproteobacteria bacterium]
MTVVSIQDIRDSRLGAEDQLVLSSAEEIIAEAREGRMFILVDDEDRENEGDLIIPAQMVTPAAINFMATHGRGLICLAMERAMIERLGLTMMVKRNTEAFSTAFTVSIEAKEGVSTGISAPDRARTIQVAIDPQSGSADIVTPGHIFPLQAQDGGVLVRAGHTEAAVDLARLAGLRAAGVICEIMKDDGTMARLPDLVGFAQRHGMKIGTIADLIAFRLRNEKLVERMAEQPIQSRFGGAFRHITYRNRLNGSEVHALVKGDVSATKPTLVRVHAMNIQSDVFGAGDSGLHHAMETVGQEGAGVIVMLKGMEAKDEKQTLRGYGIGAQVLRDLGVHDMILLTSAAKHIIGLNGFGLNIVEQRPL